MHMKLTCDVCGNFLSIMDDEHAICNHCGIEYGSERLQELYKQAALSGATVPKQSALDSKPKQQKSGCGIWFLIIMAILDLIIGTHGIVAVFCLIILIIVIKFSKKN
jgi:hypothetical protein